MLKTSLFLKKIHKIDLSRISYSNRSVISKILDTKKVGDVIHVKVTSLLAVNNLN